MPAGLPAWVLSRAGLDPAAYRGRPLGRRVPACLRALRVDCEDAARARMETHPERIPSALNTVLIGVTSFFRDGPVFEALRSEAVASWHAHPGPIRVLSLGCASGAELYSVALLLAEAGLLARSDLLGIDCRQDAVASARAGLFTTEELAAIDAALRARYFEPARSGWRIASPLARAARWEVGDATRAIPAGPWDLVLCRNLFIYLQHAVVDGMLRRIVASLAPRGFLVVGKAERPPAEFGLAALGRCVHRRA
jgi:chemotaxis methyl-accepting protein methylase